MAVEEVPICRVCRSEATPEEPLFFPCRCSGSIKYVHQNCLEEWLAHSNKKYCELCGHEYAFSPLYDPNMPESIPKHLIVKQMLANVSMIVLQVIRTALVLGTWGFLLPYMVYWIARVLIWSAKVIVHTSIPGDVFLDNFWEIDTANMTSMVASANMRFKGYDSWHQWYVDYRQNVTVPAISSRTGILNGANNFAEFVYSGTLTFVSGWARIFSAATGYDLSKERILNLTEIIVELVSKSFEGSIIVLISLITFFILFILRDWIVANAPLDPDADADEDLVDAVEEDEQAQQNMPVDAVDQQLPIDGQAARPERQEAHVPEPEPEQRQEPPLAQIPARPAAAENPPRHLLFEQPAVGPAPAPAAARGLNHQLPANSSPDEELNAASNNMGTLGRRDMRHSDEEASSANSEQRGRSLATRWDSARKPAIHHSVLTSRDIGSTSSAAEAADDSSDESDREEALRRRLRDIIMASPALDDDTLPKHETSTGSGSGSGSSPGSAARQSNTWSYADEVYQNQSGSDSESDSELGLQSHSQLNAHLSTSSDASSYLAPSSRPSAATVIADSSASKHADIGSMRSTSTDQNGSSWSFVAGESSSAAAKRASNAALLAGQVEEHNPQVFTSEVVPGILAAVNSDNSENLSSMSYDERVRFIERRLMESDDDSKRALRNDILTMIANKQAGIRNDAADIRQTEPSSLSASGPALLRTARLQHGLDTESVGNNLRPDQKQLARTLANIIEKSEEAGERLDSARRQFNAQKELNEELVRRMRLQQQEQRQRQQQREEFERQARLEQQRQEEQQRRAAEQAELADQNQNENQNGLGLNLDENFGDLDAADGILEAMGLRGPFFNAIQYFMMLLLIVAVVLSLCVWTPMIIGRLFLALNPVRRLLYLVHVISLAIDWACELAFDRLTPFVWVMFRPMLMQAVNAFGPTFVWFVTPVAPSLKVALSSSDSSDSLWDKLSSPQFRDFAVKQLRQPSSIVQLLFPWVSTSGSNLDATESIASGVSLVLSATSYPTNAVIEQPMMPAASLVDSAAESVVGGLQQALDYAVSDQLSAQKLNVLLNLQSWERELWERLNDYGVPIYRLAIRLHSIASAMTLTDRALLILIGNLVCVYIAWSIVSYTPRQNKRSVVYQISRMFLLMVKITYFIFIEVVLFPMLCGYCLDVALAPLIPESDKKAHYWAILNNSLSRRAIFWGVGLFFMLNFARVVSYCRQVARPGLLWFIRDPNDPEFHPMREALEGRTISQETKIGRSAVMYCGTLLVCFGLPSYVATKIAPSAFPMKCDETAWTADFPRSAHLTVMLLVIMMQWSQPYVMARVLLGYWWKVAARVTRLSEFILGTRDVLDEGRWIVRRYPQMPVVLPRLWMPTHVVSEAFEELSREASDRARVGETDDAIPTSEFNARLQGNIDVALMQRYPWVEFVLDGQNIRAPAIDTVSVVPGRKMLVPVDDQGRPIEDRYDYEAADYPEQQQADANGYENNLEQRDLPPAAPESSFRDLRFKPMQHKVIYVPPQLRPRVIAFVATMWLAIAVIFIATVVSSMLAGKRMCMWLGKMPRNDYIVFAIGLLGVVTLTTSMYQAGCYVAGLFNRDGGLMQAFQELRRRIYIVWLTIWKFIGTALVFVGLLPALYGLVFEVYVVVVLREYLGDKEAESILAHTSFKASKYSWMYTSLHMWVVLSVLRWIPNNRVARAVDQLFAGHPHTWHVWRAIVEIGIPGVGMGLVILGLPFAVTLAQMWIQNKLTHEAAMRVLFVKDIKDLARNALIIVVSVLSLVLVWWACIVYKRWSRLARDRVYLVGQQLHNVDEDNNNNNEAGEGDALEEVDDAQVNGNEDRNAVPPMPATA
ncbi:hypothetical protein FB645_003397 [Coemansia sp. IMI 203386]|nr:hypothetical protein FB645_003397 [Coemansia sp. IMI 203386]